MIASAEALRKKYDDLIKEALLKADPELEITRADDVAVPGTISTDIITRIMHSDVVVADISYDNPNVFYELGLRHAARPGTIIIKDKSTGDTPFDISHLRHISYEDTASGLRELSERLGQFLDHLKRNPNSPDSQFLEHAKLTHFAYPQYVVEVEKPVEEMLMESLLSSPRLIEMMVNRQEGEELDPTEMMKILASNPESAGMLAKAFAPQLRASLTPRPGRATPSGTRRPAAKKTKRPKR